MKLLLWIARLSGAIGALLSVVAVVCRASGLFWLGGMQAGTLLLAGIGAMTLGVLAYVALMAERGSS